MHIQFNTYTRKQTNLSNSNVLVHQDKNQNIFIGL